MTDRRPDVSYWPEYGPLPPEQEHHRLPSRGRAPWPLYHGEYYPGARRLLDQRVRREPFGLSRYPLQPYAPFRILRGNGGSGSSGGTIHPRPRQEDPGLNDVEFRKAMEQLKRQTFRPSDPQKAGASRKGGRGIFHTRRAATERPTETEEEKACTICLETFLPGEQVVVTPCSHMFHQDCITPWVKGHGNCPVCRFALCERRNIAADNIHGDGRGGEVELDLLAMMSAMDEAFSRFTLSNFMSYH